MKRIVILLTAGLLSLSAFNEAISQDVGLKWLRDFGSTRDSEFGTRIHTDEAGNVYTTGAVGDMVNFNRQGATPIVSGFPGNVGDAFITKHDANGNLLWVRTMGGTGSERGNDVITDKDGNVYIIGTFNGTANFDPGGAGTGSLTTAGGTDIFVAKFNSTGVFQWVKGFGGSGSDGASGIRVDTSGNIYITGYFSGQVNFGNITLTAQGVLYAFVAKLDKQGDAAWAHEFGVTGPRGTEHKGVALDLDQDANVYVTGTFTETVDFNPSGTVTNNLVSGGGTDGFVLKLSKNGDYVWARSMSGIGSGTPLAIRVDGLGNLYVAGWFTDSMDVNPNGTKTMLKARGGWDGFVTKYDVSGNFTWAFTIGNTLSEQVLDVTTDRDGNVYVTGYYEGTVDFDPDLINTVSYTSVKSWDIFVARYTPGGALVWVKVAGGAGDPGASSSSDVGQGIAVDTAYNVYVTGYYQGTVDFDPEPLDTVNFTTAGRTDVYIWKLRCPLTESSMKVTELCSSAYDWNGVQYTQSGIYTQSFDLGEGCDSVVTLDLTLGEAIIKPLIRVNQQTLMVASGYASYQWFLNGVAMPGETDSTLQVSSNGNYRVAVTNRFACTDTADTYVVNNVSVKGVSYGKEIRMLPNPASSKVYITGAQPQLVLVSTLDGRVVINKQQTSEILVGDLPGGMYIITVYGEHGAILLKEKLIKVN